VSFGKCSTVVALFQSKSRLVQVAKAIAEGKVKATLSDLDRLIRLEEFLKHEQKAEGTVLTLEYVDSTAKGEEEGGEEDASTATTETKDDEAL
jgi:hypothetical protein